MQEFMSGFFVSLSLIFAIGAQNAFVLKQGIKNEHVFMICLVCALCDAILIFAGILGMGHLVLKYPIIKSIALYGGFAFLFMYSLKSFYSAYKLSHNLTPDISKSQNLYKSLLLTLAFTWLNPHVYLDTMFLIGSLSTKFGSPAIIFGVGAAVASFIFFFTLGYGAKFLAPIFKKNGAWKILEIIIGVVMMILAFMILFSEV